MAETKMVQSITGTEMTLADLQTLVERCRDAGFDWTADVSGSFQEIEVVQVIVHTESVAS